MINVHAVPVEGDVVKSYMLAKGRSLEGVKQWAAAADARRAQIRAIGDEVGAETFVSSQSRDYIYGFVFPDGAVPPDWREKRTHNGHRYCVPYARRKTTRAIYTAIKDFNDRKVKDLWEYIVDKAPEMVLGNKSNRFWQGFSLREMATASGESEYVLTVAHKQCDPPQVPFDAEIIPIATYWGLLAVDGQVRRSEKGGKE